MIFSMTGNVDRKTIDMISFQIKNDGQSVVDHPDRERSDQMDFGLSLDLLQKIWWGATDGRVEDATCWPFFSVCIKDS